MKRKHFEDMIRRNRQHMANFLRYARWEASQNEFKRARSVFERGINEDYKNVAIWLAYAEVEMKNKFVNHARNIWIRATTLLPRVTKLWLQYILMEEILENYDLVRQIYERWMEWKPKEHAWFAYISFEI